MKTNISCVTSPRRIIKFNSSLVLPLLLVRLLDRSSQAQVVATMEKKCPKMVPSKLDSLQASSSLLLTDIRLDLSSQEKGLC